MSVGDGSRRSEEIIKNLSSCAFERDYHHHLLLLLLHLLVRRLSKISPVAPFKGIIIILVVVAVVVVVVVVVMMMMIIIIIIIIICNAFLSTNTCLSASVPEIESGFLPER